VGDNVVISHRGAAYEIGRGRGFYGIWPAGAPRSQPAEWWPATPAGWSGAWSRFTRLEAPAAIVPVRAEPILKISASTRAIVAAVLLAVGVVFGAGALFPGYIGSPSLAGEASELVPHLIYLAAWLASTALILLGGTRLRAGALLAAGTSVVTFGLFFADLGTAVSGSGLLGAGLVLGLIGWASCAAGAAVAVWIRPDGPESSPAPAHSYALRPAGWLAAIVVAGLGVAASFAPAWDSFTLRTASGQEQSLTAGNAFANPGAVIAGDVMVMIALVAVLVVAGLLRPVRQGGILLAGAIIPMAAQAISAVIQLAEPAAPAQFGISPAQAALAGLTISSGPTAAFWIYCAFVAAAVVIGARMITGGRTATAAPAALGWDPAGPAPAATAAGPAPWFAGTAGPPPAGMPAAGMPATGMPAAGLPPAEAAPVTPSPGLPAAAPASPAVPPADPVAGVPAAGAPATQPPATQPPVAEPPAAGPPATRAAAGGVPPAEFGAAGASSPGPGGPTAMAPDAPPARPGTSEAAAPGPARPSAAGTPPPAGQAG
jgi:hypothetical protein